MSNESYNLHKEEQTQKEGAESQSPKDLDPKSVGENGQQIADNLKKEGDHKVFDAIGKKGNFGKDVNKGSILEMAKDGDKNSLKDKLGDSAVTIGDNVNLRDSSTGKPIQKLKKETEVKIDKSAEIIEGKNSKGRKEFFIPVEVDGKKGVISSNFLKPKEGSKDGADAKGGEAGKDGGGGSDAKENPQGGGAAISESEFNGDSAGSKKPEAEGSGGTQSSAASSGGEGEYNLFAETN